MRPIRHTIDLSVAGMLAFLLVLGVGLLLPGNASAAPSSDAAASAASAKLESMSANLSATMKSYDAAATELAKTRASIVSNSLKAEKLDGSIALGRKRLAAEVRFLYLTGGVGFAEILLGAATFEEFVDRSVALRRVTARDADLVDRLTAEQSQRAALRRTLAIRERQQATLVATMARKRSSAQKALNEQQAYVDSLSASVTAALDAQRAVKNTSKVTRPTTAKLGTVVSAKVDGRGGRYSVLAGQPLRYAPTGVAFDGVATWYGNVRPNMSTASGRPFDENELTCAHKTLPFGTRIAVTFRGRSVIVTVTDRGPYGQGRVIDLSKRAATIIGLKSAGVGQVHCEVVRPVR